MKKPRNSKQNNTTKEPDEFPADPDDLGDFAQVLGPVKGGGEGGGFGNDDKFKKKDEITEEETSLTSEDELDEKAPLVVMSNEELSIKMQKLERKAKRLEKDLKKAREELAGDDDALGQERNFTEGETGVMRYLSELSEDAFTFLVFTNYNHAAFWVGTITFCVQMITFSLLLVSVVDPNATDNPFQIPADVTIAVRVGQLIAIVITVITQEDMRYALELTYDSIGKGKLNIIMKSLKDDFSKLAHEPGRDDNAIGLSKLQWFYAIFFRFTVGSLGLVATFILIVTQSTVFDLLLNFTAVEYVSQFDDMAYGLANQGFLGDKAQDAAEMITERNTLVDEEDDANCLVKSERKMRLATSSRSHGVTRKPPLLHTAFCTTGKCLANVSTSRAVLLIMMYAAMLTAWIFVVINQVTGQYLCGTLLVQFEDTILPELGTFNGLYDRKNGARLLDRVRYQARHMGKTWLVYCHSEEFWSLVVAPDGRIGDPCESEVRSDVLHTFDIMDLANEAWFVINAFGTPIPMENFDMSCYECGVDVRADNPCGGDDHGICLAGPNECQCINGWYGHNCEFPEPGSTVQVDARGDEFVGIRTWPDQYKLLENAFIYQRPVYYQPVNEGESFDIMIFTGRRWALFNRPTLDGIDSSFHPQFSVPDFNATFLSEAVDYNSPIDTGTPIRLEWFHRSSTDRHGIELADTTRGVGATLLRSDCDNTTNPCMFGGTCNDNRSCDCIIGSQGSLCEVPPIGNARCDAFLNTPVLQFDGGDCCEITCQNSPELVCNRDDSGYFVLGNQFCQRHTDTWLQYGNSIGGLGRESTNVDYSRSGQTLAIGQPTAGTVSLYDRFGSALVDRSVLMGSADLNFGWSVAVSSGPHKAVRNPDSAVPLHVAVGSPSDRTDRAQGSSPGSVVVFECLTSRCRQMGSALSLEAFNVSKTAVEDRFGYSVALSSSGDVVAVGSPMALTPDSAENGAVAIFQFWEDINDWEMMGNLLVSPTLRFYGRHVALSADGFVVAMAGLFPTDILQLVVEVQRWNATSNSWGPQGRIAGDHVPNDDFLKFFQNQRPLAMSDDGMVIALGTVFGGRYGVQVYEWNGADWAGRGSVLRGVHEGDVAGWSIDLSSDGSAVVVGTGGSEGSSSVILVYAWNAGKRQYEQLGMNGVRAGKSSVALAGDGLSFAAMLPSLNGVDAPEAQVYALDSPRCSDSMSSFQLSLTTDYIFEVSPTYGGVRWDLVDRDSEQVLLAGGPYTGSLTSYLEEACLDIAEDSCILFTYYHDSDGITSPGGFLGFLGDTELTRNNNSTGYDRIEFGDCSCPAGESRFRIEIQVDRFPQDTTWVLLFSESREIIAEGGPYETIPYVYHVYETCVPSDQCLMFTIRDLFQDGLKSDTNPPGYFYGFLNDEMVFNGGENFGFADTHFFGKCDAALPAMAPISCPNGSVFRLELHTDEFPIDQDWTLEDAATGNLLSIGGPYNATDNSRFIVEQACVDSSIECAVFTMYDWTGNGMCCGNFGNGSYSMFWDGQEIGGGDIFTTSERFRMGTNCPATEAPTATATISNDIPFLTCPDGEFGIRLEYQADKYPEDTTFDLTTPTGDILWQSLPFDNTRDRVRFHVFQTCVPSNLDCLVFTIYDAFNDGICCDNGEGYFDVFWGEDMIYYNGGVFGSFDTVQIGDNCPAT